MLVDLARGQVVIAAASAGPAEGGGWEDAFRGAGLPPTDGSPVTFSGQEVSFAWRSHFVAASDSPLAEATRDEAEAKGWTLFELPTTSTAGLPDAMISMFEGTSR